MSKSKTSRVEAPAVDEVDGELVFRTQLPFQQRLLYVAGGLVVLAVPYEIFSARFETQMDWMTASALVVTFISMFIAVLLLITAFWGHGYTTIVNPNERLLTHRVKNIWGKETVTRCSFDAITFVDVEEDSRADSSTTSVYIQAEDPSLTLELSVTGNPAIAQSLKSQFLSS